MFKLILLLNPIYVTLFWILVLNTNKKQGNVPKLFLGRFMTVTFLLYLSHFFYYLPLPEIYHYIDPFYQLLNLLVYPMYYIYIRLLTVDDRFKIKKHSINLAFPILIFILYGVGTLLMTKEEHIDYLYRQLYTNEPLTGVFLYQKTIYLLCRIAFILQGVVYMWLSYRLVVKHKEHILNYYANTEDDSLDKIHILNITLSITIIMGILMSVLGKESFMSDEKALILPSVIFSIMLFWIGWLGNKQRALLINDILLDGSVDYPQVTDDIEPTTVQLAVVREKIIKLFEEKKIYLNKDLTIWEVARIIGTNRTYISSVINNDFKQNFSCFVNSYRVKHAQAIINQNPKIQKEELAERSGFGSVSSMHRAFTQFKLATTHHGTRNF
ncbi:MAG: Helix-turn-helix domain protein [Bacteroidetes bacterium ADurb.Bin174]|nr:MAG: Helix-turn-helix domain protein [Bacteroidetes bacterium ADurb.Bin174]